MAFKVGDRVRRIHPGRDWERVVAPRDTGKVYTITRVFEDQNGRSPDWDRVELDSVPGQWYSKNFILEVAAFAVGDFARVKAEYRNETWVLRSFASPDQVFRVAYAPDSGSNPDIGFVEFPGRGWHPGFFERVEAPQAVAIVPREFKRYDVVRRKADRQEPWPYGVRPLMVAGVRADGRLAFDDIPEVGHQDNFEYVRQCDSNTKVGDRVRYLWNDVDPKPELGTTIWTVTKNDRGSLEIDCPSVNPGFPTYYAPGNFELVSAAEEAMQFKVGDIVRRREEWRNSDWDAGHLTLKEIEPDGSLRFEEHQYSGAASFFELVKPLGHPNTVFRVGDMVRVVKRCQGHPTVAGLGGLAWVVEGTRSGLLVANVWYDPGWFEVVAQAGSLAADRRVLGYGDLHPGDQIRLLPHCRGLDRYTLALMDQVVRVRAVFAGGDVTLHEGLDPGIKRYAPNFFELVSRPIKENVMADQKVVTQDTETLLDKAKGQGAALGSAVMLGGQLVLIDQAGETMLDLARELAKDVPILDVLLTSPDGRELAKLLVAVLLHSGATYAPGMIPKAQFVRRVAELQVTMATVKLATPRLNELRKYALLLASIGEQIAEAEVIPEQLHAGAPSTTPIPIDHAIRNKNG